MRHCITRIIPALLVGILFSSVSGTSYADPQDYSSRGLRPVAVKPDRAMGRLVVQANFSSHRIRVDGAEYPPYLLDSGIEVTSNELHEVTVSNGSAERKYRVSVNPRETMMLYVDLGKTQAKKDDKKKDDKKDDKKKDEAMTGFLTVTADAEAQVYVDGKLISSKTPLNKHQVNTGSHTVRVYFFDTRKFSKSREVYVGRDANMSTHFAKE